jgi:hypothetical protein
MSRNIFEKKIIEEYEQTQQWQAKWSAIVGYLDENKRLANYLPDLAGADWEEFSITDLEPVVERW